MVTTAESDGARYIFQRKAGKNIIDHRPVFSPDGESLAVIVENVVRVYNIETGDCVRILETEIPVDELIAIQFPENEEYNLYGCSNKGHVTIWTWDNGAVLREIKFDIPTGSRLITFNLMDNTECIITAQLQGHPLLYVARHSVKTGEFLYHYKTVRMAFHDMIRVALGWCNKERFVAITNGTKALFIQNIHKPHIYLMLMNYNELRITSMVAHHKESMIAISDTVGRTTIFRGNLFNKDMIAREILHWHRLPPLDVCFSLQGTHLYSGGMEKVLVKWTIGNLANEPSSKEFIPRLPGLVRYITTNNTHVAISLSNNSLVIANVRMRVLTTILESGGLSPAAQAFAPAFVYHPPSRALLLPGRVGHLQMYSTLTNKVLYNVDITGLNPIPIERWNLIPLDTEVTCSAICGNGVWLVTSEYRNDGIIYPEEKLKFWKSQKGQVPFELNTVVNLSHGGCNVVSIALDFEGQLCITAGTDEKFRIWTRISPNDDNKHKKISWSCLSTCYYSSGVAQFLSRGILNNFKIGKMYKREDSDKTNFTLPYLREYTQNDVLEKLMNIHKERYLVEPDSCNYGASVDSDNDMGGLAISADGSLIAAWFGCKLTLWETHLCKLRTTLSHPALRPKGIDVKFGSKDAAHYLVCTTEACLAVWSLLSLTIKWLVPLQPVCLTADRFSNRMAITTKNNDVFVFSPQSSKPILVKKKLLAPETGVFKHCCFGPSLGDYVTLYLMRNNSEIYSLEPERSKGTGRLEVISKRNLPKSNFGALLAEQQLSAVTPANPAEEFVYDANAVGAAAVAQLTTASPHMLPPMSLLCTSFLLQLSGHQQPEDPIEDKDEPSMEVDQLSSDDEDVQKTAPLAPRATELWTVNYEAVNMKRLQKMVKEPFLDLHSTSTLFGV